jgi:hypothetical protein
MRSGGRGGREELTSQFSDGNATSVDRTSSGGSGEEKQMMKKTLAWANRRRGREVPVASSGRSFD